MVVISAYFSGSETGMMTLNRYRLRHMAKQGNRSAKRVEKLLRKPDRLISLVLIGNNLVNILASALGTIVGMRLYGDAGVAIATGVLTFVVLVFAEVLPKTIAALYPEKVAYPSSFLLAPLQILMMPLVWLLNAITRMLMRMMGIKTDIVVSGSLSKEELRTIVHESRSQISRRNQDMLLSVLDLEKMTVDDIMVPRSEIIGIDINDDWKSILRQLSHSPHGRIVLYRDSLDDAISMLRVREAWRLMSEKKEFTKETMLRAADEIYFVPEGTPLSTQLVKFQRNKKKVGLVVNEYGDIQGLVTVEDILAQRHRTLLQGADAVQHGLVDRIFGVDVLRERRDLLGDQLHEVGVEVDAHLQQRNEEVVARRIAAVVHLKAFFRFAEGAELSAAHRNQHALVGDDERHGFDDERIARRHEEIGVGDDGILVFGVFRSRFDLLDLLFGLEADLHEVLDGLLLLDRGVQQIDPQDVVVAQLIEELGVGIADDLVVLLEVNRNHKSLSVKFSNP